MSILSPSPVGVLPAWADMLDPRARLAASDPELDAAIELERQRQADGLELIAVSYTQLALPTRALG